MAVLSLIVEDLLTRPSHKQFRYVINRVLPLTYTSIRLSLRCISRAFIPAGVVGHRLIFHCTPPSSLLLIRGSSPMVEGIRASFAAGKWVSPGRQSRSNRAIRISKSWTGYWTQTAAASMAPVYEGVGWYTVGIQIREYLNWPSVSWASQERLWHEKLMMARHNRLIMIHRNRLTNAQHIKLIAAGQQKLTRIDPHGFTF